MRFKTQFNGYSLAFSPFVEGRLAVTTSQNFGIIGNGQQYVLEMAPGGRGLVEVARFETADGLYDCCWSEENENVLVSASGDGSVKVWDVAGPPNMNPLRSFEEHTHEVYAVHWNQVRRDVFLSASWDDTVKLWTLNGPPGSVRTFAEHAYCVYASVWSPQHADIFATASGDCTLKIWDVRQPHSTLTIPAHEYEILSCDWNKYNDCVIATGSVDRSVKLWDIRNPNRELAVMPGHQYAVRRVKCSPHAENVVYSASYDMTLAMWDWKVAASGAGDPMLRRWAHHTEFAVGLDCSVLREGLLGSCGWDEMVYVWPAQGDPMTF
jgi:peroxin-7